MSPSLSANDCLPGYHFDRTSGNCIQTDSHDVMHPHYTPGGQCVCGTSGSIVENPDDRNKECMFSRDNANCPGCVYQCTHFDEPCEDENISKRPLYADESDDSGEDVSTAVRDKPVVILFENFSVTPGPATGLENYDEDNNPIFIRNGKVLFEDLKSFFGSSELSTLDHSLRRLAVLSNHQKGKSQPAYNQGRVENEKRSGAQGKQLNADQHGNRGQAIPETHV